MQQLEQQVARCQREHAEQPQPDITEFRIAMDALRLENEELRRRQAVVIDLLNHGHSFNQNRCGPSTESTPRIDSLSGAEMYMHNLSPGAKESFSQQDEDPEGLNDPSWALLPSHKPHDAMVEILTPWMLSPAVVRTVGDLPTGPDLIYGSNENPLANSISISMSCAAYGNMAEPERLAMGWVSYVYTKWLMQPTPARFRRLPYYIRPTHLQRRCPHIFLVDVIPWPRMRDNLITAYESSEDKLFAMRSLIQEMQVVWKRNAPLFVPDNEDSRRLLVRPEFFSTLQNLDGWVISEEFVLNTPALCAGITWAPVTESPLPYQGVGTKNWLRMVDAEEVDAAAYMGYNNTP